MKPAEQYVSTGHLPSPEQVQRYVDEAHQRFRAVNAGERSQLYPPLARVPARLFGICAAGTRGGLYATGDADYGFAIMSVAKPFVFALVCETVGADVVRRRLGVNATGLPFNSLAAVERGLDGRTNPMVNAGAIAAVSLASGDGVDPVRFRTGGRRRAAVVVCEPGTRRTDGEMRILVTGFDPFDREPVNASWEAVKRLPDEVDGAEIIKVQIPTSFARSGEVLHAAIVEHDPDVIVGVGQAGGRFAVTPERVAINVDDGRIADNDGAQPVDVPVRADGPAASFSSLPVKAMVAAMRRAGFPPAVSNTAGGTIH